MPAINRTLAHATIPKTLPTHSRHLSASSRLSRTHDSHPTSFSGGFSSTYIPDEPTRGPLSKASTAGTPKLTPVLLKEHLDKYVVGQDRAKKVVSVAIYNHYARIRELRRQEAEEQAQREKEARWELRERERNSHPVESECFIT